MPHPVADIFRQAAQAHRDDPRRRGNVVAFADGDEIVYSGDLHGHRENLARLISLANLPGQPTRRLILQELIHGPADEQGLDRSLSLLMRAARLKIAHPDQVCLLLANHDVAQITGAEITKAGQGVCESFLQGVRASYAGDADEILAAAYDLLTALPLAARTPGGVWMSHSLPAPNRMALPGLMEILSRPYEPADLKRGGPVYEWTWGRGHTPDQLHALAQRLGVTFFLLAHRHNETGFEPIGDVGAAILSDHSNGRFVRFPASDPMTAESLAQCVQRIGAAAQAKP